MAATGQDLQAYAVHGAETIAVLIFCSLLTACTAEPGQWMDHTALVILPSRHQAGVAFSFGAEPQPEDVSALASRNIAVTIAAGAVVRDGLLPTFDTMDFRNGRVFIHTPRTR